MGVFDNVIRNHNIDKMYMELREDEVFEAAKNNEQQTQPEQENNLGYLNAMPNVASGLLGYLSSKATADAIEAQTPSFRWTDIFSLDPEVAKQKSLTAILGDKSGVKENFSKPMLESAALLKKGVENINKKYGTSEKYKNKAPLEAFTDIDYLTDPRGLWSDFSNGVGSSLLPLGAMIAAPEVALPKIASASKFLPKMEKWIDKFANTRVGQYLGKEETRNHLGSMAMQGMVSTPRDAYVNSAEIYDNLKGTHGINEIAERMREARAEEMPYDFLLNSLFGGLVTGRAGKLLAGGEGASLKRKLAQRRLLHL